MSNLQEPGEDAGPSTINDLSQLSLEETSTTKSQSKSTRKSKLKELKPIPEPKVPKTKPKPVPVPISAFENPAEGEEETVHEIYESIAPHFSQTRHKPWPLITSFLTSLPPHSLGLDSGAGNGKYLPTAQAAGHSMIALDRSLGLLSIAKQQEGDADCVRGDLGCRGWRDGVFDFTISVAAIHHLSTPLRRQQAVQALLPALKLNKSAPYSRFFIYVWAYEQGSLSKRSMGVKAASEQSQGQSQGQQVGQDYRESELGDGVRIGIGKEEKIQDVLVPWVLKNKPKPKPKSKPTQPKSKQDSRTQSQLPIDSKDEAATNTINNDETVDAKGDNKEQEKEEKEEETQEEEKVFNRYYHLFIEGELRKLIFQAGIAEGYRILPSATSSVPSTSTTSSTTTPSTSTKQTTTVSSSTSPATHTVDPENEDVNVDGKWLRIRGEGWEADNWWVEAEVGVGAGQ